MKLFKKKAFSYAQLGSHSFKIAYFKIASLQALFIDPVMHKNVKRDFSEN